ncbi:response regulator [Bacteroides xylanisolvens]|nr:response regulator [Bacteroides xylanisolvens]
MLMEPAINLYSPNEKSELIRENYQEILSVLAAHQIALWEYDIITGKCSFSELGQEAINSFIRESPDLILMDICMPVMDGIQATEKIRTISLTVPIIAVTAYAFYTEQQQAIQAGCNAVISKPYSLERLRETIESYIG